MLHFFNSEDAFWITETRINSFQSVQHNFDTSPMISLSLTTKNLNVVEVALHLRKIAQQILDELPNFKWLLQTTHPQVC